jgi:hypothetical protein
VAHEELGNLLREVLLDLIRVGIEGLLHQLVEGLEVNFAR